jgi:hypothetical protein
MSLAVEKGAPIASLENFDNHPNISTGLRVNPFSWVEGSCKFHNGNRGEESRAHHGLAGKLLNVQYVIELIGRRGAPVDPPLCSVPRILREVSRIRSEEWGGDPPLLSVYLGA